MSWTASCAISGVSLVFSDSQFKFYSTSQFGKIFNPLNTELNPVCHLLALLGAHHIVHVGRIRVKPSACYWIMCVFQAILISYGQHHSKLGRETDCNN
jgi:hypothetical protein